MDIHTRTYVSKYITVFFLHYFGTNYMVDFIDLYIGPKRGYNLDPTTFKAMTVI